MSSNFMPKQITKYEAAHLTELQGNVSETVIDFTLDLMPPFRESDTIHDNACGAGAVSEAIMTRISSTTNTIHIDATDINPQFIAGCKQLAQHSDWPLDAQVMDAKHLGFPDNRFSHSFTFFALHCIGDATAAAKEVYRTLKVGGVAATSVWVSMPHSDAIKHAHWRTRGKDCPLPVLLEDDDFLQEDLKKALQGGGFDDNKMKFYEKVAYITIPDLRRWTQLAWSYLGVLSSGWLEDDEAHWDEALDDIFEQLNGAPGISRNEKGEAVMKFVACIAIVTK
ncbi:hypothetical protein ACHAPJ_010152 [Fusarium lateritium]